MGSKYDRTDNEKGSYLLIYKIFLCIDFLLQLHNKYYQNLKALLAFLMVSDVDEV